ncbi:hypothetical protein C1701_10420 [Actinoalloteichus sp. AHMU CJ021]|uniref:AAA family ATPase n=1 Tax=Actinoalloteichus sp. AHMU CJ021 TaxID=2072503 RepID=UPI000CA04A30|nr:hypothetical protein C1701_10420 [Actinoalloteichus sp. AHMU CJ021]
MGTVVVAKEFRVGLRAVRERLDRVPPVEARRRGAWRGPQRLRRAVRDLVHRLGTGEDTPEGEAVVVRAGSVSWVAALPEEHRAVVVSLGDTERRLHVLVALRSREAALRCATGVRARPNPVNGVFEVLRDAFVGEGDNGRPDSSGGDGEGAGGPLSRRPLSELTDLGLPRWLAASAVRAGGPGQLVELLTDAPEWQRYVVLDLAAGDSAATVRRTYGLDPVSEGAERVDLVAAVEHPAAAMEFAVVDSPTTVDGLLEATSTDWWFYPHPVQRWIAFREWGPGPVRVLGGPGTGKTTVASHRAIVLARRRPDARVLLVVPDERRSEAMRARLAGLVEASVSRRVEVRDVGELARRVRAEASDGGPSGVGRAEAEEWRAVLQRSAELSARERAVLTPAFLTAEYREVLGGRGLAGLDGYLAADRGDRAVELDPAERATVWRLARRFEDHLRDRGAMTSSVLARTAADLAERAARETGAPRVTRYHHLVVDDAQDLDPTHWRLLRALVPVGPDDVLLCVDTSQRTTTTEQELGGPEVGESVELVHERRATLELVRTRSDLFGDLVDVGGGSGLRSGRAGPAASFLAFDTAEKERRGVVELVRAWRVRHGADGGTAVLATTAHEADVLARRLASAGLGGVRLGGVVAEGAVSVWVGTLVDAVGCAFRRVVVVGADAERLPARNLSEAGAAGFARLLERRERRLLHLACARASDQLVITWTGEPSRFLARPQVAG